MRALLGIGWRRWAARTGGVLSVVSEVWPRTWKACDAVARASPEAAQVAVGSLLWSLCLHLLAESALAACRQLALCDWRAGAGGDNELGSVGSGDWLGPAAVRMQADTGSRAGVMSEGH